MKIRKKNILDTRHWSHDRDKSKNCLNEWPINNYNYILLHYKKLQKEKQKLLSIIWLKSDWRANYKKH